MVDGDTYTLIVRQEPKQARMCGVGGKADRRPIDPPPIVQLIVESTDDGPYGNNQSYLQNPHYFMIASLAAPDRDEELHFLKDGKTRSTTGAIVSSLYHLKDTENNSEDVAFFVFPDLSVRTEGSYRLKMTLYEVAGDDVVFCNQIFTKPFYVYSAKKFPGMEESTPLSCSLADQGIKIRIRKDIRARRNMPPGPMMLPDQDDDEDDAPTLESALEAASSAAIGQKRPVDKSNSEHQDSASPARKRLRSSAASNDKGVEEGPSRAPPTVPSGGLPPPPPPLQPQPAQAPPPAYLPSPSQERSGDYNNNNSAYPPQNYPPGQNGPPAPQAPAYGMPPPPPPAAPILSSRPPQIYGYPASHWGPPHPSPHEMYHHAQYGPPPPHAEYQMQGQRPPPPMAYHQPPPIGAFPQQYGYYGGGYSPYPTQPYGFPPPPLQFSDQPQPQQQQQQPQPPAGRSSPPAPSSSQAPAPADYNARGSASKQPPPPPPQPQPGPQPPYHARDPYAGFIPGYPPMMGYPHGVPPPIPYGAGPGYSHYAQARNSPTTGWGPLPAGAYYPLRAASPPSAGSSAQSTVSAEHPPPPYPDRYREDATERQGQGPTAPNGERIQLAPLRDSYPVSNNAARDNRGHNRVPADENGGDRSKKNPLSIGSIVE